MSRVHTEGNRLPRRSAAQETANILQKQIDKVTEDTEEIKEATAALQVEIRTSIADVRASSESQFSQIETRLESQIDAVLTTLSKMEAKQEDLSVTIIKQIGAQEERDRVRKIAIEETHRKADEARYKSENAKISITKLQFVGILITIVGGVLGMLTRTHFLDGAISSIQSVGRSMVVPSSQPSQTNLINHNNQPQGH